MGWLLLQLPVTCLCPQGLYYTNGSEIYKVGNYYFSYLCSTCVLKACIVLMAVISARWVIGWLLLQLPVQCLCPQGLHCPNGSDICKVGNGVVTVAVTCAVPVSPRTLLS